MSNLGNKEVFSQNLKYYMEHPHVERNKICKDLNFKYTTFSDWINGKVYPRIDKIETMATYFGIQKADLIEKRDPNKKKKDPLYNEYVRLGLIENGEDLNDKQKELLIKLISAASDVLLSFKDDPQK